MLASSQAGASFLEERLALVLCQDECQDCHKTDCYALMQELLMPGCQRMCNPANTSS